MWRRLGLSLGLTLCLCLSAQAVIVPSVNPTRDSGDSTAPKASAANASEIDSEDLALFVLGNLAFTLYHEIGHGLVSELELPVLGKEEDAVDSLASLMMISEDGDETLDRMLIAAADGWQMAHQQNGGVTEMADADFSDEHSLDIQRYYGIICLMVGSDSQRFAELADVAELPQQRRESCESEYAQVSASWGKLLEPHVRADGDNTPSAAIRVVYTKPPAALSEAASLIRESGLVEEIAKDVESSMLLPNTWTITLQACNESNAYRIADQRQVVLCYELVQEALEFYLASEDEDE